MNHFDYLIEKYHTSRIGRRKLDVHEENKFKAAVRSLQLSRHLLGEDVEDWHAILLVGDIAHHPVDTPKDYILDQEEIKNIRIIMNL